MGYVLAYAALALGTLTTGISLVFLVIARLNLAAARADRDHLAAELRLRNATSRDFRAPPIDTLRTKPVSLTGADISDVERSERAWPLPVARAVKVPS